MLATGAGAEARRAIGVVVFYGVVISVVLTLAVVPAVYTLVARNTKSPQTIARLLDRLRVAAPPAATAGAEEPAAGSVAERG
jgi:multidrug efflux pump